MSKNKHENYDILNLIGFGLAKFDKKLIQQFSFKTKTAFYNYLVEVGVGETANTIKNRQDLFDPYFDNGRMGRWQKANIYRHRFILIDSLYGDLTIESYAGIIKIYLRENFDLQNISSEILNPSPIIKSKYKQLQKTGQTAEVFFKENFQSIPKFREGKLEDARMFGDGYDFQIRVNDKFFLAEVKGVREGRGSIRLTKNEFFKAEEYKNDFGLIIVSNLYDAPKMTALFNPLGSLELSRKVTTHEAVSYHSKALNWSMRFS